MNRINRTDGGFVLATSLVMLLLMTMLTTAVYFGVESSQKNSASAESSTEAFYYAETAVNYMRWSLSNDAEFDSYTYPQAVRANGNTSFDEPVARPGLLAPSTVGDYSEWRANPMNSSGEDSINNGINDVFGQMMYFDNSFLNARVISYQSGDLYANGAVGYPDFFQIHTNLPRYIRLDIDSYGNVAPAMPPYSTVLPHHGNTEGVDFPTNGALVWVTGGNQMTDYYTAPVDDYTVNIELAGFLDPTGYYDANDLVPGDNRYYACPLTGAGTADLLNRTAFACDRTSGAWLTSTNYGLVVYALGYVNGRARKLIRLVYVRNW